MKLTADKFELVSVQLSVFTPNSDFPFHALQRDLLGKWSGEKFKDPPFIMPGEANAAGMPADAPRFVLQGEKGKWKAQLAPARADFFWYKTKSNDPATSHVALLGELQTLVEQYRAVNSAPVGRLATVLGRFAPVEKPGDFLAEHFCRPELRQAPLNRPAGLELHAHKVFELAPGWQVNSWVRNRTGHLTVGGKSMPIVHVEQDLNTLAEESNTKSYSMEQTSDFVRLASTEFDRILALYYP